MIGNPHRWLFFTATLLMCAASFYASGLAQAELLDPYATIFGTPRQLTLPPHFETDIEEGGEPSSAASVIPNGTSCPTADPTTILLLPEANKAKSEQLPTSGSLPDSIGTGSVLGTGTGCPPTIADIKPTAVMPPGAVRRREWAR